MCLEKLLTTTDFSNSNAFTREMFNDTTNTKSKYKLSSKKGKILVMIIVQVHLNHHGIMDDQTKRTNIQTPKVRVRQLRMLTVT